MLRSVPKGQLHGTHTPSAVGFRHNHVTTIFASDTASRSDCLFSVDAAKQGALVVAMMPSSGRGEEAGSRCLQYTWKPAQGPVYKEVSKGNSVQGSQHREQCTGKSAKGPVYREVSTGTSVQGSKHRDQCTGKSAQGTVYREVSTGTSVQGSQHRDQCTGK